MADGVGVVTTFTSPAAGANFSTTVPPGKAWRIWGGSCRFVASATVANRQVGLLISQGGIPIYAVGNTNNITASQTWTICLYEQRHYNISTLRAPRYYVGIRAIWLPSGTTILIQVPSIQAGDQIDRVVMLVEEIVA